ncbi:hypothetical protein NECAME_15966 [Necator americanus]|uniref:Uncharacterized protein n=1 Tax=Necator americanus TaxID=51031 RepID=W2SF31_NECAM|nr:hypothetical protein NECAME_15966 [Necator americanus]ETN68185.1 hypothetical protein NECAME_15966 [Necator americanus]
MYRDQSMMRHQCFCNSDWAGGVYATPTIAGGRDGGAVATAWATLLGKGRDGYINACHRVVETTRRLADLLSDIDGITLRGAADLCIVAFETTLGDIYVLVDFMTTKGWHVDPLLSPEAARVPVTLRMCEEGVLEAFVEDVYEGLRYLSENPTKTTKTSAFYHMLQTVADRMLVDELSLIRLQAHYSVPPPLDRDHRAVRSLSVDGRKISMLTSTESCAFLAPSSVEGGKPLKIYQVIVQHRNMIMSNCSQRKIAPLRITVFVTRIEERRCEREARLQCENPSADVTLDRIDRSIGAALAVEKLLRDSYIFDTRVMSRPSGDVLVVAAKRDYI